LRLSLLIDPHPSGEFKPSQNVLSLLQWKFSCRVEDSVLTISNPKLVALRLEVDVTGVRFQRIHENVIHDSDGNGNIVGVVNGGTGRISATLVYSPFGELIARDGDAERDRYGFSTKWGDGDTGSKYYGYRFYSAEMGRWLNRDPIGEEGGVNLYGFIGNNGTNRYDVLGLQMSYPPSVAAAASQGWTAAEIAEFFRISILAAAKAIDDLRIKKRCSELGLQKRRSIDAAEALGGCTGNMTCSDLRHGRDLWKANADDRWNYDKECHSGGDTGHVQAQQSAFKAMKNCEKLLKRKCCSDPS
jgi:RHS repeat-associated protein